MRADDRLGFNQSSLHPPHNTCPFRRQKLPFGHLKGQLSRHIPGTFAKSFSKNLQTTYNQQVTQTIKTFDCHAVWLSFCAGIESLCKKNRQAKCRQPDGRTDGQYLYVERRVWWLIGINRTISLISTIHRLRIGDELSCLRKQTHAQNKQNVQEKQRTSVYLCHQIHLFLPPKQHVPSPRYG